MQSPSSSDYARLVVDANTSLEFVDDTKCVKSFKEIPDLKRK